jgi:hypothetical protein
MYHILFISYILFIFIGSIFQIIKYNLIALGLYLLQRKIKICRKLLRMIRKLCYPEISIDQSGDELFYDLFQSYFDMFQPSSFVPPPSSSSSSSSIYSESKISCSLLLLQQLIHE